MFCPNCGTQIPETATFCPNCGSAVPHADESQQATPVPPAVQPTYEQPASQPTCQQEPTYQAPTYGQPTYQQGYQQQGYQQDPTYQQQDYQQDPTYQQQGYQQQYQQQYQQPPVQNVNPAFPKDFAIPSISDLFCGLNSQVTAYGENYGTKLKWHKALTIALIYIGVISTLYSAVQYVTGGIYEGSASYIYSSYPLMRLADIFYGVFCVVYAAGMLYARMLLAKYKADGPRLLLFMMLVNVAGTAIYGLLSSVATGAGDFSILLGQIVGVFVTLTLHRIYYSKRMYLFSE